MRRVALVFAAFAVGALPRVCRSDSFRVPNSDCLINQCHGSGAALPRLVISSRFDGISGLTNTTLLSQHNIAYPATNDLGNNEDEAANECKKCHGNALWHRYSGRERLHYPDAIGTHAVGEAIPVSTNFSTYQDFCLSCHDGFVVDTAPATALRVQFNGPVSAQQARPSLRSNPASQQAGAPWVVPAVPPKDVNFSGLHLNQTPAARPGGTWYFDYYETNGHGLADSLEGTGRMNVTCLAGSSAGNAVGCHTAHGSANRFLMDDGAEPGGVVPPRAVVFGTGRRTAADFSQFVCLSTNCHTNAHSAALLSTPPGTTWVNVFHGGWTGTPGQPSHTFQGGGNGMTKWQVWTRNINVLAAAPVPTAAILPFWMNPGDPIENRLYTPTIGNAWLGCLTCHDPHGTALTHFDFKDGPVTPGTDPPNNANTQGMLRIAATTWFYTDPLCNQCHAP